jgi:hypothetical protein
VAERGWITLDSHHCSEGRRSQPLDLAGRLLAGLEVELGRPAGIAEESAIHSLIKGGVLTGCRPAGLMRDASFAQATGSASGKFSRFIRQALRGEIESALHGAGAIAVETVSVRSKTNGHGCGIFFLPAGETAFESV